MTAWEASHGANVSFLQLPDEWEVQKAWLLESVGVVSLEVRCEPSVCGLCDSSSWIRGLAGGSSERSRSSDSECVGLRLQDLVPVPSKAPFSSIIASSIRSRTMSACSTSSSSPSSGTIFTISSSNFIEEFGLCLKGLLPLF